ncbi:MAG: polysaccharide deacetylase family protein [Candidatus Nanoarchaeia archaeon]
MNRRTVLKLAELSLFVFPKVVKLEEYSPLEDYCKIEELDLINIKKDVYITIDDGPRKDFNSIFDKLKENDKFTFFMLGCLLNTEKGYYSACKTLEKGHTIGNHSYNHPSFSSINIDKAKSEIERTHNFITKIYSDVGVKPEFVFRFPYGDPGFQVIKKQERIIHTGSPTKKEEINNFLNSLGYKSYFWDVDTEDWRYYAHSRSLNSVLNRIKNTKNNDVVLMHEFPI